MTMKKMISVLAMALLVIGAAQAQDQEQVRKMFIHMNDGSVLKIETADIQEVTYEMDSALPDVPTTIEEAKDILLGSCWKLNGQFTEEFYENFEGAYISIGNDPLVLYWVKVKDSPTDVEYAPYAGKYLITTSLGFLTIVAPTFFNFGAGVSLYYGINLQRNSFDLINLYSDENVPQGTYSYHCVRVEPFDPSEVGF
jgi:hypothetical protein